jgi:hypothetical protein
MGGVVCGDLRGGCLVFLEADVSLGSNKGRRAVTGIVVGFCVGVTAGNLLNFFTGYLAIGVGAGVVVWVGVGTALYGRP